MNFDNLIYYFLYNNLSFMHVIQSLSNGPEHVLQIVLHYSFWQICAKSKKDPSEYLIYLDI